MSRNAPQRTRPWPRGAFRPALRAGGVWRSARDARDGEQAADRAVSKSATSSNGPRRETIEDGESERPRDGKKCGRLSWRAAPVVPRAAHRLRSGLGSKETATGQTRTRRARASRVRAAALTPKPAVAFASVQARPACFCSLRGLASARRRHRLKRPPTAMARSRRHRRDAAPLTALALALALMPLCAQPGAAAMQPGALAFFRKGSTIDGRRVFAGRHPVAASQSGASEAEAAGRRARRAATVEVKGNAGARNRPRANGGGG